MLIFKPKTGKMVLIGLKKVSKHLNILARLSLVYFLDEDYVDSLVTVVGWGTLKVLDIN